jgi:hypothetical protein
VVWRAGTEIQASLERGSGVQPHQPAENPKGLEEKRVDAISDALNPAQPIQLDQ